MQKIIVLEKTTLQDCIDASCPLASFAFSRLLRDRDIKVNGVRVQKNIAVQKGDCIEFFLTVKEKSRQFFSVVYEDAHFLVVDKASGVSSEGLFNHLKQMYSTLFFIHRLDRNTCGLMIFAKTELANQALLAAFKAGTILKIYHAIVVNNKFEKEHALLKGYLKKDAKTSTVTVCSKAIKQAVPICTEYTVLQKYNGYAKVQVVLYTGKTHQIRAHMASIGHAIAGDEKYGDREFNKKYHIKRQILVAKQLKINLPAFQNMQNKIFTSTFHAELKKK